MHVIALTGNHLLSSYSGEKGTRMPHSVAKLSPVQEQRWRDSPRNISEFASFHSYDESFGGNEGRVFRSRALFSSTEHRNGVPRAFRTHLRNIMTTDSTTRCSSLFDEVDELDGMRVTCSTVNNPSGPHELLWAGYWTSSKGLRHPHSM